MVNLVLNLWYVIQNINYLLNKKTLLKVLNKYMQTNFKTYITSIKFSNSNR